MEVKYSESNKAGKLNLVLEVIAAIVLGSGAFAAFITTFGLAYGPGTMFRGSVVSGIKAVWNQIADVFGSTDYVILTKYQLSDGSAGQEIYGLFLTLIFVSFIVISFLIIKSRLRPLLLVPALPVVILMLGFRLSPTIWAGTLFAVGILAALMMMNVHGKVTPSYLLVPTVALAVGAVVALVTNYTFDFDEPGPIKDFGEGVNEKVEEMRYGTDALPAGDIGSVSGEDIKSRRGSIDEVKNLLGKADGAAGANGGSSEAEGPFDAGSATGDSNAGDDSDDAGSGDGSEGNAKKTALSVEMSAPLPTYLRGFVGANYEDGKWETLSNDTFYDMRDRVYWLDRQGFDGITQMSTAAYLGGYEGMTLDASGSVDAGSGPGDSGNDQRTSDDAKDRGDADDASVGGKTVDMSVKVASASKKYAFTPYELLSEGDDPVSQVVLPRGLSNYGGSHLGTKGVLGKDNYSFRSAGDIVSGWTDAVGKLYTAPENDDIKQYFINESNYNVTQYEKYLDIPDNLVKKIKKEIGTTGDISKDHADYKDTINTIRGHLNDKYIYSETFKTPKAGSDAISDFIDSKKGADIQFASLAVLMFRYYGIPARYVEGYLVTPSNVRDAISGEAPSGDAGESGEASDAEDGDDVGSKGAGSAGSGGGSSKGGSAGAVTVDVKRACNHAWMEFYVDGFGWVPFEATPEYSGIMNEADLTKGLQNVDYESKTKKKDKPKTEDEDEPDGTEDSGNVSRLIILIITILLLLLAAAAILAILALIGIAVLKWIRWRLAFRDKDPKVGVKALYQFGHEKKWPFSDKGESIGMRASYSTSDVTEDDRTLMKTELGKAKETYKEKRRKEKTANVAAKEKLEIKDEKEDHSGRSAGNSQAKDVGQNSENIEKAKSNEIVNEGDVTGKVEDDG